jgi:hypothetical protein
LTALKKAAWVCSDIVRKTKPDFSIPAENQLRQLTHDPSPLGVVK